MIKFIGGALCGALVAGVSALMYFYYSFKDVYK